MTITAVPSALSYDGDGSTVSFSITWKYFAKSDVLVTHRNTSGVETVWVLDTDYTLTIAGIEAGGTLTATTAPASGEKIVIELNPPSTQDSSLPLGGSFPSTSIEDELDQSVQRDVKIERLFTRALRVPTTDTQTGNLLDLPIDSTRASKFLAFDANGKPIAASGTSADLTPVSAFVNTLLDDADASTARATLAAAGTTAANTFSGSNTFSAANTFEGGINYAAASGTDTYTATLSPAISSLQTGAIYYISFANTNTSTAPTLNVNSLGAKTIVNVQNGVLIDGEINGYHILQYDGTSFRLLNPAKKLIVEESSGSSTSSHLVNCNFSASALVDDIIAFNIFAQGRRDAADFGRNLSISKSGGTATIEFSNGNSSFTQSFIGHTVFGSSDQYITISGIAKVTVAGTITGFGINAVSPFGTAPLLQSSKVRAFLIRGAK